MKLTHFPITLAFLSYIMFDLTQKDYDYWFEIFKKYKIGKKCKCGCKTFALHSPNKAQNSELNCYIGHYGDLTVIMHTQGSEFVEVEIPDFSGFVFDSEFLEFENANYISTITNSEAKIIVKKWFDNHPEAQIYTVCVDS